MFSSMHINVTIIIIIKTKRASHHLQGTRAIILRDKHLGFCSYSSPGLLSRSFLGPPFLKKAPPPKITEGSPLGPHWPISRINPAYIWEYLPWSLGKLPQLSWLPAQHRLKLISYLTRKPIGHFNRPF